MQADQIEQVFDAILTLRRVRDRVDADRRVRIDAILSDQQAITSQIVSRGGAPSEDDFAAIVSIGERALLEISRNDRRCASD
jgi:hypothetical protein